MRKTDFLEFIGKIYLSGNLSSEPFYPVPVTIESGRGKVFVKSAPPGALLVDVDFNVDMPDGEFIVGDIKELMSVLGAFGDEITIEPKKIKQTYCNQLHITDNELTAKFALADPKNAVERPTFNGIPNFEATIELNKDFVNKFQRAKRALNKSTIFAIIPDVFSKKLDFVVNYSTNINENSITIPCSDVTVETDFSPLFFNLNYMSAILSENTEYRSAKIEISSAGLMVITFSGEDYDAKYYIKSLIVKQND